MKMPPTVPPRSMHDVRVEALRRRSEGALRAPQEVAELAVLEKLLEDQRWSGSIEDIIKGVEQSETEHEQHRFQIVAGRARRRTAGYGWGWRRITCFRDGVRQAPVKKRYPRPARKVVGAELAEDRRSMEVEKNSSTKESEELHRR